MDNSRPNTLTAPLVFAMCGDIVGEHDCPACGTSVQQVYRPGRARLYCNNACRQQAYRWRRANGVRTCVERNGPAEQSVNRRRHALRDRNDPATKIRDPRSREVTVCGAFARPVRQTRNIHKQFVPESENSCLSCIALVGAGPFGSGIPEVVRQYWDPADQARMAPAWSAPPGKATTARP